MPTLTGLIKDTSPPATNIQISPITIPDGTELITTLQWNKIVDIVSGDDVSKIPNDALVDIDESKVIGLSASLAGKADSIHTHVIGDTTGLQAALDAKAALVHTHVIGDITGLQIAIDAKEDALGFIPENIANKGIADGYAGLDATGLIPIANLGTGTPDGTKFLRDDGVFVEPTGGGHVILNSGTPLPQRPNINITGDFVVAFDDPFLLSTEIQFVGGHSSWKTAVQVVANTNIATLTGEQTIDGVLTSFSRILLVGQTNQAKNGIYVTSGGAWVRPLDFSSSVSQFIPSAIVAASEGTIRADSLWMCTTNGPVTVDTTPLVFQELQFSGGIGGHVIQDDGSPQIQRVNLNFAGTPFVLTDNPGNGATDVSLALTSFDISDFDTQVQTSRLDQLTVPTAAINMNSQQMTSVIVSALSNGTVAGVNVGTTVIDPTAAVDGDLWYNSVLNKYRARENGVNVDLIGGASPLTAKGDVFTRTTTDDERIAVGLNGQVLVADSSTPTGLTWGTVSGSGLTDGNKGDITISSGAAVWNINAFAVGTAELATNSVTAVKIPTNSITGDKLLNATITAAKIGTGVITSTQLGANSVTATQIAASAVGTSELATNAITAVKISAGTITAVKLAANSVTTTQLASSAVTGTNIANATITGTKLTAGAITSAQMGANSIITSALTANSVTGTKIVNATITGAKLTNGTITATQLGANSVTASQIAANAVGSSEIANLAVSGAKIAAGTITPGNLQANSVTAAAIAANAVGSSEIANAAVTLAKMANIPTNSFLGRNTAGTGVPQTMTLAVATALLNIFTTTLKGLVPPSGGGNTNFLRADGVWAVP